jgi:hypothetical protein
MIGTAGFASIVTGEMLASRLVLDGVGRGGPISLWTNLFMGPVGAAVGPAVVAFFVGTIMFAIPLLRGTIAAIKLEASSSAAPGPVSTYD